MIGVAVTVFIALSGVAVFLYRKHKNKYDEIKYVVTAIMGGAFCFFLE